jgi:[protein-PII] uridylyltransferase
VFFVTDRDNRPLNDARKYAELRETLTGLLDSEEEG